MRLIILWIAFLTLFSLPVKAENLCMKPDEMSKTLYQSGFVRYGYGVSDRNFLLTIWIGEFFVVTAEDDSISCVLTKGKIFHRPREFDI